VNILARRRLRVLRKRFSVLADSTAVAVEDADAMNPDTFMFISLTAVAIVAFVAVTATALWLGVRSTDDAA
jgi:hypothetical protein